jgi:peptidoglycan hydrolase-like protein with peptidoglycan-binding domain
MHDDADVRAMQTALSTLGYKDAQGRPLHADGDFGPATRHAVEAFQRDHALSADGVAGKDTLGALGAVSALRSTVAGNDMQANTMEQPGHAGNAMYTQALAAVHRVDESHGRTPDQQSANFAGSLVAKGQAEGLSRIDQVVLSEDGTRAWAIQGELNSPFRRVAEVETAQAVNTPLARSTRAFEEANARQVQASELAASQEQTEQQAVASQPWRRVGRWGHLKLISCTHQLTNAAVARIILYQAVL